MSKECKTCKNTFEKDINCSLKNWGLSKFCSRKCASISFIGKRFSTKSEFQKEQVSFNKDKKLPKTSGEKHGMWKGGRLSNRGGTKGYVEVHAPTHPHANSIGYVREHRLVMEKSLGRFLETHEVVHHINEDMSDNHLENLMLFSNNGEHTKYHSHYSPFTGRESDSRGITKRHHG